MLIYCMPSDGFRRSKKPYLTDKDLYKAIRLDTETTIQLQTKELADKDCTAVQIADWSAALSVAKTD